MKMSILMVIQIIFILLLDSTSYAWTGEPWGPISRETVLRIADEMIDFSWSPLKTIRNWNYGEVWWAFPSDEIYKGIAYCQINPQQNWAQFYNVINNTPGGDVYYGNDCSGFVSISWKLTKRYTTSDFICDALNRPSPCGNYYNSSTDDFVHSLGEIGTGKNGLELGDAFVKDGHIILFGIKSQLSGCN